MVFMLGRVAQSVGQLTQEPEVPGLIPRTAYFDSLYKEIIMKDYLPYRQTNCGTPLYVQTLCSMNYFMLKFVISGKDV